MRFARRILTALLLLPAVPAIAQTPPPTPIIGTVAGTLTRGANWCAVERGTSIFQRSGSGSARVAVPEITYTVGQSPPVYYTLAGRMQLIFSTGTSGKAYFDFVWWYPTTVSQPTFSAYQQTYNSVNGALLVSFRLDFPGCSVLVSGQYRA